MGETLISMFYNVVEANPDHEILLVKRDGAYRPVTFRTLGERVRSLAAGLKGLGVAQGDRVAMVSENRQEFIEADFAILSLGAITVAMHAPLSAAQVRSQILDCTAKVLFVSTLAQRDKAEQIRSEIPSVEHVIAFDSEAADGREVTSYESLLEAGRKALAADPHLLDASIASVKPEDIAAIIYTSGTTGESKGAMLTHHNFASNARMVEDCLKHSAREDRLVLCFLPQSHVFARLCDLYCGIKTSRTLALAEGVEQLLQNIREVRPNYMCAVPRVFEKIASLARHLISEGNPNALMEITGGRIKWLSSGGAALAPDVAQFFIDNNIQIHQGYGLTETSPVISISYEGHNKVGAAGVIASPEIEVKIADDGEILTRGPHVMKGYWNKPEATAEVIDADGWFHTGDIGRLDEEGFLYITDRKKDLIVTAYGKNVAPQQIESLLCFDPFIEQAMVYGDAKKFLTAIIIPNHDAVKIAAEKLGLGNMPVEEILKLPMAHTMIKQRIDQALCNLAHHEQIQKFIVVTEPFTYEQGEMTVTAKLRRKKVIERFKVELEALYMDGE